MTYSPHQCFSHAPLDGSPPEQVQMQVPNLLGHYSEQGVPFCIPGTKRATSGERRPMILVRLPWGPGGACCQCQKGLKEMGCLALLVPHAQPGHRVLPG